MDANERIRVQPMTSRGLSAVDHSHHAVPLDHQRVGEGEPLAPAPTTSQSVSIGTSRPGLAAYLATFGASVEGVRLTV